MEKHGGAVVDMKLADCMTRNPQTIGPTVLASEALTLMEKRPSMIVESVLSCCTNDVGQINPER